MGLFGGDPIKKLEKQLSSKDKLVKIEAIAALGKLVKDESFNLLTDLLTSQDKEIKTAAIKALGEQGYSRSKTFLSNMRLNETDEELKAVLLEAMGKIKG